MGGLIGLILPDFLKNLFSSAEHIFEAYQNKQITFEQLKTQLGVVAQQEFTKVIVANADMVTKTFAQFSETMRMSRLVRIVWSLVTISQAFVLFWYQWAVPFIVWQYGGKFPPASDLLLEWGYGLLVLLVGGGVVAIRPRNTPPPLRQGTQ